MTPEERHADVVARYPGGLTPVQFRREALASADSDEVIDPPALSDWFAQNSLLIAMWMDGLIELRGGGREKPMWPWYITAKGKAAQQTLRGQLLNQAEG